MIRDDLLEAFLIETRDLVARARADLAALDRIATDGAALDSLFRALHTLKGSTALFELAPLTQLLHAAETRLDRSRNAGRLHPEGAQNIEATIDATERWLDVLDAGGEPNDGLVQAARHLAVRLEGEDAPRGASPRFPAAMANGAAQDASGGATALRYTPSPDAYFRGDDPLAILRAVPGLLHVTATAAVAEDPLAYDPFKCTLGFEAVSSAGLDEVRAALRFVADQIEITQLPSQSPAADSALHLRALHVEAARLDALTGLAGELVVAKAALAHEAQRLFGAREGDGVSRDYAVREAALDRIVRGLHAAINGLRLTPLTPLFARFPRQVRELASGLGKSVDFEASGEHVAVDKAIAEGLFEPLLHLLRNAIDHGVEPPDVRQAAGKPQTARISLTAHALGREVILDVMDDGRGIDLGAARRAAVTRGLMDEAAAAALSDHDAARLVFSAGLSTATEVSALSGRGVGLDAVEAAVARLGGRVSLDNRPGRGLRVRLILPAQIVLQKVLVVAVGEERFGVPLDSVQEVHRVQPDELTLVRETPTFVRRDTVIPLVRLADMVGADAVPPEGAAVVLQIATDEDVLGVHVDRIEARVEAPLRPMTGLMQDYPGMVGTIIGVDGQVIAVLDLAELVR